MTESSENGGHALSREDMLTALRRERRRVDVPELGGHVYVQTMSGRQFVAWADAHNADLARAKDTPGAPVDIGFRSAAIFLAATVVDEAGTPIFTEADIDALADGPPSKAKALRHIYQAADELNRITVKAQEESAKN